MLKPIKKACIYYIPALVLILSFGCKKEKLHDLKQFDQVENSNLAPNSNIFNVSDMVAGIRSNGNLDKIRTSLGNERQNPFEVSMLAEAHNLLYGTSLLKMETTDLYVKFLPTTLEEYNLLLETDETLYDYPLHFEVLEMGDYYQELGEEEFPELFAIVDKDFNFPLVSHEIIDELNLSWDNPFSLAASFRLTGNTEDINDYVLNSGRFDALTVTPPPGQESNDDPECDPGCYPVWIENDDFIYFLGCNCPPSEPVDPTIADDCACISSNTRRPSGCVKVEDTELSTSGDFDSYEGVREVKVIVKDTWFTEEETYTNATGCWSIYSEYRNNMWMWIKFKSPRVRIRGTEKNWTKIFDWISPVKDYVGRIQNNFNNIRVNYNMWSENGSRAHIYWGAATVNNALHEFDEFALDEGLQFPPQGLDVYVAKRQGGGFALMNSQGIISQNIGFAGTAGSAPFIGPFAPIVGLLGWVGTSLWLPQVSVGIDLQNSESVKEVAYHEFAHASHYRKVNDDYWDNLVYSEIIAFGHGDANSQGADIISLCESWAFHLGFSFTHRKYPPAISNVIIGGGGWQGFLERRRNEVTNHVPIGYYHDLIDDNGGAAENACDFPLNPGATPNCGPIVDVVSGFENSTFYNILGLNVSSMVDFNNALHTVPGGNNVSDIENLFSSY